MKQILHHSNNLLIALSVGLLFSLQSCGEKSVYNEYNKIATVGWDFGTPVRFETEINDTLSAYDITIQVRNNTDYAYQNFWIFVESTSPSGIVAKDTLEFLLADNTGKWLGKGISSTKEISGLYLENIKLSWHLFFFSLPRNEKCFTKRNRKRRITHSKTSIIWEK